MRVSSSAISRRVSDGNVTLADLVALLSTFISIVVEEQAVFVDTSASVDDTTATAAAETAASEKTMGHCEFTEALQQQEHAEEKTAQESDDDDFVVVDAEEM